MKKLRTYYFVVCCICTAVFGCSDEQSGYVAPPQNDWGIKARIDSISWIPGDPAVFKFDYNSDNKVKGYTIETGWSSIAGLDSVVFDYQPDKITARMSFLKDMALVGRVKMKVTGWFYLQDGKIVCASIPLGFRENLRDSIIYHYDGDKLSRYEVYEVQYPAESTPTSYFCYVQNLNWQNDDLIGMSAVNGSETIYDTSFAYDTHSHTVLLPYMSFEYLLDSDRTYISVLANMGYFGVLPKHEITEILVTRKNAYRYQMQIDYHYGQDNLPFSFDFHYWEWYKFTNEQGGDNQWNVRKSQWENGLKVFWLL